MERLKQCPEAFKVGEILGKAFDSLNYVKDGGELGADIYRPRARSFRHSCDRAAAGRYVPQTQRNSMAILHEMG